MRLDLVIYLFLCTLIAETEMMNFELKKSIIIMLSAVLLH